jgi:hypothetical protein
MNEVAYKTVLDKEIRSVIGGTLKLAWQALTAMGRKLIRPSDVFGGGNQAVHGSLQLRLTGGQLLSPYS